MIGAEPLPPNWVGQTPTATNIMLQTNLFKILFHAKHISLWNIHPPAHTMHNDLSKSYYHPDLLQMITAAIKQCTLCPLTKKAKRIGHSYSEKDQALTARSTWHYNCMFGLPTCHGKKSIFVFVDQLTGYAFLFPSTEKSSPQLLRPSNS